MTWKTSVKRNLVKAFRAVMPYVQNIALQDWLLNNVYTKLLDPQVVPDEFVSCQLWRLPGSILVNPYEFHHWRPYWFKRLHEIHIEQYMKRNLAPGDTFIDVGCNCGHHTVLAACLIGKTGKVIAFEPNQELAVLVNKQLANQGLTQVTLHPVGLADKQSIATLNIKGKVGSLSQVNFEDNIEGESDINNVDTTFKCDIRVGDDIIQPHELKGRILLKIDVEGLELEVLKGMNHVLAKFVDCAIIEVTQLKGERGIGELFSLMNDAGFQGYQLLNNGCPGKLLTSSDVKKHMDVLFVKESLSN